MTCYRLNVQNLKYYVKILSIKETSKVCVQNCIMCSFYIRWGVVRVTTLAYIIHHQISECLCLYTVQYVYLSE